MEYLFPYDYEAKLLAEILKSNGLTQVLHNMPPGDWDAGERGIACLPDRVDVFREGVATAIGYARILELGQLHAMAGLAPEHGDPAELHQTYTSNLRFAAAEPEKAGIRLVIEMIKTRDIPGFYLSTSAQTEEVLAEVASDNLYIQYDIYHMQIMEGQNAGVIIHH